MTTKQRAKAALVLPFAVVLALLCYLCEVIGDAAGNTASWMCRWVEK